MKNTKTTTPPIATLVVHRADPVGIFVLYDAFHADDADRLGTALWIEPAKTGPKITTATMTSRPMNPAMMVFIGPADMPPPSPPLRAIYLIHSHNCSIRTHIV